MSGALASLIHRYRRHEPDKTALYPIIGPHLAALFIERVTQKFPDDPIVQYYLARYDCVEGQTDGALKRLTQVLGKDPENLQLTANDHDLEAIRDCFEDDLLHLKLKRNRPVTVNKNSVVEHIF